tara:strand:- start:2078 stop:2701 length:624 start_codon:yes stop_codon:yes gene_type:complete
MPGALSSFLDVNIGSDYENSPQIKDQIQNLELLCNEIQIPGVTLSTADVKQAKKGITQKLASAKVFNELDVSFYCDANSLPIKFFRGWQDFIIGGLQGAKGQYAPNHTLSTAEHAIYSQRYYDEYASRVTIHKLEKVGPGTYPEVVEKDDDDKNVTRRTGYRNAFDFQLNKAYPYTVSSVPYSYSESQLVKVTVGFYYEYSHLAYKK